MNKDLKVLAEDKVQMLSQLHFNLNIFASIPINRMSKHMSKYELANADVGVDISTEMHIHCCDKLITRDVHDSMRFES